MEVLFFLMVHSAASMMLTPMQLIGWMPGKRSWDYNPAHGMYQLEVTKPGGTVKNINVLY
jgi:hypothetical protein